MALSKYEPLKIYLKNQNLDRVSMRFGDIENLVGFNLPKSSRDYRAWWANNPSNSVITHAWLAAGYETSEVDMAGERLTFRRVKNPAMTPATRPTPRSPERDASARKRSPLFGALKGLLTLRDNVDLTAPADPDWAAQDDA